LELLAHDLIRTDGNVIEMNQTMSDKIRSFQELREFIRLSLRTQHPEWVESDGASPIADSYEARLSELLGLTGSQKDVKTSSLVSLK
jgi:hypothetical protein